MKYKIFEKILTESIDNPLSMNLLREVEAVSFDEAYKLAKLMWPEKTSFRIETDTNTAIEFGD